MQQPISQEETNAVIASRADSAFDDFFNAYAEAMTTGHFDNIRSRWASPTYIFGDGPTRTICGTPDLQEYIIKVREKFHLRDVQIFRTHVTELTWMTDNVVIAHVKWTYLNRTGKLIGSENAQYTLKTDSDGDFRIHVIVKEGPHKPEAALLN